MKGPRVTARIEIARSRLLDGGVPLGAVVIAVCCTSSTPPTNMPPSECVPLGKICDGPLSAAYMCTGVAKPTDSDPSLSCAAPTTANDATNYCCKITTPMCVSDMTSTSCNRLSAPPYWQPFVCQGSAVPDPSQVCIARGSANGVNEFCCTAGVPSEGCFRDPSASCARGYVPYSCNVVENLNNISSTFHCSSGNVPLCCQSELSYLVCAASTSMCPGGVAFSCEGVDLPESVDPSLACEGGTISASAESTAYCCFHNWSTACVSSHYVSNCVAPGLYGFLCTGSTRPEEGNPGILCNSGTQAGSGTAYCCAFSTNEVPATDGGASDGAVDAVPVAD
jgi:hypothetical protein